MWSQYLCTIVPICLVTVVFLRIVRSSQNDTALATEVTDEMCIRDRFYKEQKTLMQEALQQRIEEKEKALRIARKVARETAELRDLSLIHI